MSFPLLLVRPLVTYTEGIPDRLTLRIHSVYVHEVTRLSSGQSVVRILEEKQKKKIFKENGENGENLM